MMTLPSARDVRLRPSFVRSEAAQRGALVAQDRADAEGRRCMRVERNAHPWGFLRALRVRLRFGRFLHFTTMVVNADLPAISPKAAPANS